MKLNKNEMLLYVRSVWCEAMFSVFDMNGNWICLAMEDVHTTRREGLAYDW
jgi:hypothetical protein